MKPFKETQRFDQWWLRILLLVVFLVTIIPIITLRSENGFNTSFSWAILIPTLIAFIVLLLFFYLKLETTIDSKGIQYKFIPFSKKTILWHDISACYVRTYSPLREYGGWGIRFGLNGKAYNVKGNKGIQVVLKSGKKILFGTQNETEAERVILTYFKK